MNPLKLRKPKAEITQAEAWKLCLLFQIATAAKIQTHENGIFMGSFYIPLMSGFEKYSLCTQCVHCYVDQREKKRKEKEKQYKEDKLSFPEKKNITCESLCAPLIG